MADTETQLPQSESTSVGIVPDDFTALLQQEFKPKTERTREAVASAVQTLAEQVLKETSIVSDDAVETIEGIIAEIDRKLTELGILVVSRVNACRYCVQHHAPLAHGAGIGTSQLEAIQNDAWSDRTLWSNEEWLVVRYAEALASVPQRVDDKLFAELKGCFSERQIVDLTMRLALCAAWNKFNDALGLDTETAFQHAFAELGLARETETTSARG